MHKPGKAKADPLHGMFEATVDGKPAVVEYEPDSDLRDTEQVPLLEDGGIEAFIRREVLPYTPDAWIKEDATKIGYEVSFTRHFHKPLPPLDRSRRQVVSNEKYKPSRRRRAPMAPCVAAAASASSRMRCLYSAV